ncbi:cytochrome P450 [Trametes punicea]|nr:cytochrome P450 [Trametes punicea]
MSFSIIRQDVLVVALAAITYVIWKVYRWWIFVYRSPLQVLPGPPNPSLLYGNSKEVFSVEDNALPEKWFIQYGKHFVDRDFFMTPRLWTIDPRALNHILTHANDYQRAEASRRFLADTLGRGILFEEGEAHRKQRRIMNPAFGPVQIRDLTPIFVQKATQLRDLWLRAVRSGPVRLNVMTDLSKTTLDIIGLAGFGYDFGALNPEGKPSELNIAFRQFFSSTAGGPGSLLVVAALRFPILKAIPTKRGRTADKASRVIRRIGREIVEERKAEIIRETSEKHLDGIERKDLKGRDLLTLLIRANMAKDVPESQRLSDDEVIGQIPTFLLAGHETTSNTTTWALYALSKNPTVQQRLREELLSVKTDTPTMEELMALPYLDMVVRETLRLHPPVTRAVRQAMKDDVIPVSEPFTDRYGKVQNSIRIAKGNEIIISIVHIHRSKDIWGEDASEFRPERWEHPPEVTSAIPGIWGHLLVFLGGPRACIGYRFSLVETKAILFALVRAFEFELAVPVEDIVVKTVPLQRPSLRSAPDEGFQLPLIVKPYKAA